MDAVQTSNLVKAYGKKRAIDGLNIHIAENQITGLIGRNGAGKTTLLKLIAGYYKPTEGAVSVFGQMPFNSLAVSSNMVFIDDNMAFPQSLNLYDITREMKRFYQSFDATLAGKLLDYFQLDKKQRPSRLSKGMRSTFYAVLGIAARASLTIFDEPTTGMDASVRKDFYRLLLKEYINYPRTVILSSHLLGELTGLLENIVLIDKGHLVAELTTEEAETYAIGVRGNPQAVVEIIGNRPILHREELAPGITYIVAKAPLNAEDAAKARESGLELQPISAEDLCIYLTQNGKGGIDDALRCD